LAVIINRTLNRKGLVLIPAFAVGRTQLILYYLYQLRAANKIPNVPIYLNSPLAQDVNRYFEKYSHEHRLSPKESRSICQMPTYIQSPEESRWLNDQKNPMIILAGSGMATGGRILHHLKAFGPNPKNTILFVGFQAKGTRGANLIAGAKEVKIHGEFWPIRAEVTELENLSAHADQKETLEWLQSFSEPPKIIFITHGEPSAAHSLKSKIETSLGLKVILPQYLDSYSIDKEDIDEIQPSSLAR